MGFSSDLELSMSRQCVPTGCTRSKTRAGWELSATALTLHLCFYY